jgi:hypothetical protein
LSISTISYELENVAAELGNVKTELVNTQLDLVEARFDADRFKEDHQNTCITLAKMHAAAVGREGGGPIRGVVEDVQDLFTQKAAWQKAAEGHLALSLETKVRTLRAIGILTGLIEGD